MRARKTAKVRYSKIVVPCPKCGHGCEVSLGYSDKDEISSSSESDLEIKPPAKKAKVATKASSSESSNSSDSDSDVPPPIRPQKLVGVSQRALVSASSSPSDSSDSDSEVPVFTTAVARPVAANSRASASKSSSSSDSSDSDSDAPVSVAALAKSQKPPDVDSRAPVSESSSSDSDSSSESSSSSDSDDAALPKPLDRDQSSVHQFFSQFPSFKYDSSQPVMSEYFRMSQTRSFKSLSQLARKKARRDLKDALVADFGRLYGYDVEDLGAWQSLCRVLRFEDVPDDLEGCQELVTATYVNIIDLIDTVSTGNPVQHFDSEKELSEYTLETGNILPRKSKHAGSLLKFLLRNIFDPSNATRDNPEPLYGLKRKRKRGI
ncbi:unnamed protein product [Rhizoctonia solani]|uniref:Uncharacterized protein n=1 Tax=Rhizoctonia solani TaxID=456999 RepID=A0A8H3C2F5_9AGAM|nr:unnamed protein product [Rhizoctonia solani]